MKSSLLFFLVLVMTTLVACNNKSNESPTGDTRPGFSVDSARSIIIANNQKLGALLRSGDTTGWSEMYTEDGCAYPSGMPKLCGRSDISGFMGYAHNTLGYRDIKVNTEEVLAGNGFFVEVGTYEIFDSTGKSADRGKTMVVWKEANGKLKLYRDFFNTDLPNK